MMADAYDKSVMKKKGDAYMRNYRNNMQQYMQHPPYGREECRCHEMHQRRMERMNPPSDTGCGCDKENRKKTPDESCNGICTVAGVERYLLQGGGF